MDEAEAEAFYGGGEHHDLKQVHSYCTTGHLEGCCPAYTPVAIHVGMHVYPTKEIFESVCKEG